MPPHVVLVHGLWMNRWVMSPLARRLARCGLDPVPFAYADLRRPPAENARRMEEWLRGLPGEEVHFVAHSLGGLVVLHLFRLFPRQRPGRVVLLGTPAAGSEVARRIHRIPVLGAVLGRSIEAGLLGGAPTWHGERDLGLIVGTLGLGAGRVFGGLERPHDGTVAVSETRIGQASGRVELPVSHTGLLLSPEVARQACAFLRTGAFAPRR
jgi:pimeloyl-ACP methyl ester carboxylesterase